MAIETNDQYCLVPSILSVSFPIKPRDIERDMDPWEIAHLELTRLDRKPDSTVWGLQEHARDEMITAGIVWGYGATP